jgi:hypothetical protein
MTPMAGLVAAGRSVSVGPPLSVSGLSSGLKSTSSVGWVKPQAVPVASSVRL